MVKVQQSELLCIADVAEGDTIDAVQIVLDRYTEKCGMCGGEGTTWALDTGGIFYKFVPCPDCGGTGRVAKHDVVLRKIAVFGKANPGKGYSCGKMAEQALAEHKDG